MMADETSTKNAPRIIEVSPDLTVRDLAGLLGTTPIEIIKLLMTNGVLANINQAIDHETAQIIGAELGCELRLPEPEPEPAEVLGPQPEWRNFNREEADEKLIVRPPVVAILGHVDHGKTSLLDAILKANIAAGEAGGITQHIGAYQAVHNNKKITFLDTPGHAAFTAMRARGAQTTDIVVLVVAADDGVMPQTREAIAHAKNAQVPIIVALNKIDRANANPELVKQQLSEAGLTPDEWGGSTMVIPVSAQRKTGLADLLEALTLISEQADIRANPSSPGMGTVLEATVDRSRGVMATLLVQNGTLRIGDAVVAGSACGKLKAMFDENGMPVRAASPSTPVSVLGLSEVPHAGDLFQVAPSEKEARVIAQSNRDGRKAKTGPEAVNMENVFARMSASGTPELNLIVKADVQGSLEPILTNLEKLSTPEVRVRIVHSETGSISESDVLLASASQSIVLGFNVQADQAAQRLAQKDNVTIKLHTIIYRLLEEVESAVRGKLGPVFQLVVIGKAEVRAVFKIPNMGFIAGSYMLEGEFRRNARARVSRGKQMMYEGPVSSLRHEKDDVREVRQGFEFGVGLSDFDAFETGDVLECMVNEQIP